MRQLKANGDDNRHNYSIALAPFTVTKYKINRSLFNHEEITVNLDLECKYSGLIQLVAVGSELNKLNRTVKRKFKTLSLHLSDLMEALFRARV